MKWNVSDAPDLAPNRNAPKEDAPEKWEKVGAREIGGFSAVKHIVGCG